MALGFLHSLRCAVEGRRDHASFVAGGPDKSLTLAWRSLGWESGSALDEFIQRQEPVKIIKNDADVYRVCRLRFANKDKCPRLYLGIGNGCDGIVIASIASGPMPHFEPCEGLPVKTQIFVEARDFRYEWVDSGEIARRLEGEGYAMSKTRCPLLSSRFTIPVSFSRPDSAFPS